MSPSPSIGDRQDRPVAAIVLAAGRSTRMGGENKLLAPLGGRPIVRIVAEAALASSAAAVFAVTGHQREQVETALAGLGVTLVHNPDFARGLSTSLRAGLAALPPEIRGALILLADMPHVDARLIDALIGAFRSSGEDAVIVPTIGGRRGNPVLWGRSHFTALQQVTGDVGGRDVLRKLGGRVREFAVPPGPAFLDVDTPDQLKAVRSRFDAS